MKVIQKVSILFGAALCRMKGKSDATITVNQFRTFLSHVISSCLLCDILLSL